MDEADGVTVYCPQTDCAPYLGWHVHVAPEHMEAALQHPDSVQAALELGRLDFVSALLACIAIILVFAAFPAYRIFRAQTEDTVRAELERWNSRLEEIVAAELEERLPIMVEQYLSLAANSVDTEAANRIAEAQENGSKDDK